MAKHLRGRPGQEESCAAANVVSSNKTIVVI